jgi:hypothetical protein
MLKPELHILLQVLVRVIISAFDQRSKIQALREKSQVTEFRSIAFYRIETAIANLAKKAKVIPMETQQNEEELIRVDIS